METVGLERRTVFCVETFNLRRTDISIEEKLFRQKSEYQ